MYSKKLLVSLSPFFPLFSSLLSLSPLPFPFPFPSPFPFFFFSSSFTLSLLLFPFPFLEIFFSSLFEGVACTVYSRDVRDGTVDCNFSESIVSSLK